MRWTIETYAARWGETHLWSMPVVAETYDGLLNDINGLHLTEADVRAALDGAAGGPVAEGNTGGGTGMIAYEWKGGTGTASRLVAAGGERCGWSRRITARALAPLGVPVGREWPSDAPGHKAELGSIIVILGTDAPMMPHQLHRLAKRAAIGIGRGGTPGGNNSGDIFLAFSTANARPLPQISALGRQSFDFLSDECFDPLYLGAVEAVEEAVLNAMLAAEDMTMLRPSGAICRAIEAERLCDIMRRHGRCR